MKCAKCREDLLPEAVACANCGHPVRTAYKPPPPPRPVPAAAPVHQPQQPRFARPQPAGAIPNYIVPALFSLCCCTPFGIIAVVYAAQVNTKLTMNDPAGARLASQRAKFWCVAAYATGLVSYAIWLAANATFTFTP